MHFYSWLHCLLISYLHSCFVFSFALEEFLKHFESVWGSFGFSSSRLGIFTLLRFSPLKDGSLFCLSNSANLQIFIRDDHTQSNQAEHCWAAHQLWVTSQIDGCVSSPHVCDVQVSADAATLDVLVAVTVGLQECQSRRWKNSMHHWTWHPMHRLWQVCKWYSWEVNMLHYHPSCTSHMHKWLGACICKQTQTHTFRPTVDFTNIVAMLRWTGVLMNSPKKCKSRHECCRGFWTNW